MREKAEPGRAYYNEFEPFAAAWLENLERAGRIAPGDVDDRDIRDVEASDVRAYTQCHFFAGIGGWSHALELAGWPRSFPVWTGSCPCQPFSVAGRRRGVDDERHLWPEWHRLIDECRPPVVFGEQVASPDGRGWLAAVQTDLEALGYSFGGADLCAAGVGAPHIRQRLFFVAVAGEQRREVRQLRQRAHVPEVSEAGRSGEAGIVVDAGGEGSGRYGRAVPDAQGEGASNRKATGGVADEPELAGYTRGFWADAEWLSCSDGKARPVEPGTFPLAHGISGRVGRLRAYGNAIVPQVAATFIRAAMAVF